MQPYASNTFFTVSATKKYYPGHSLAFQKIKLKNDTNTLSLNTKTLRYNLKHLIKYMNISQIFTNSSVTHVAF